MRRSVFTPLARASGLLGAFVLAACGGGGGGAGDGPPAATTGALEIRMHDAPIEGAEHVFVTIDSVEVFRKVGDEEIKETVASAPGQYDLLELQDGIQAVLGGGTFEPGLYKSIRLIVAKDSKADIRDLPANELKNYIVVDGTPYPLVVPSGAQTGIKLGKNFTVEAGGLTVLTLDFDVRQSVHQCGKKHKHLYRLKPRIRVVPTPGTPPGGGDPVPVVGLEGAVTTTDGSGLPMGTIVSVQQGGVEVATAAVDQTTGTYSFAALEDGTYDVVVIAPGYDFASETGVVVTGGSGGAAHDFAVSPASAGAVYGVVTPASDAVTVRLLWNGFTVGTAGVDPSTGDYVFDNFAAGDYTVEATNGTSTTTASATVSGGAATQVDLSL